MLRSWIEAIFELNLLWMNCSVSPIFPYYSRPFVDLRAEFALAFATLAPLPLIRDIALGQFGGN